MNERESRDIATPGGHTVSVYTYLTAREARAIRAPYLKQAEEFPAEVIKELGYKAAVYEEVENRTLRTLIASFDGKRDGEPDNGDVFDIVQKLLSLPEAEFKFIKTAVNEIASADEQKKTS